MPGPHDIEVIEEMGELRALRCEWDSAAPPDLSEPWETFSWMEAAADAFGSGLRLRVVTVTRAGRITGIAPMILKPSKQPLRPMRLDLLGGEEMKEPNRLIALDPVSLELLADSIVAEPAYPVRLSRLPNDRDVTGLLLKKFSGAGWITRTRSMSYPYLDLQTDPVIRKSMRSDLRRARRKAEPCGPVRFEVVDARDGHSLLERLGCAFRVEASGWKGRNRSAILSDQNRKRFFERYASLAQDTGVLRLMFLHIGGEPAAVQYGIESAGAFWLLNVGYDERYRHCSPGNLLMEESIKRAATAGLSRYNFLGKEEEWVKRWSTDAQDCLILAAYRPNAYGVRAMLSDALYLLNKRRQLRSLRQIKALPV